MACLKTAIGLITAFSETFTELFPKSNYLWLATGVSILACIFANVGLTKIIMYSTPVLMFIYPLAITLILLALLSPLFKHSKIVYRFTTLFTMVAAFVDGVKASPEFFVNTKFAQTIIGFGENYLPFFNIGMGWIVPALIGFIIGIIVYFMTAKNRPTYNKVELINDITANFLIIIFQDYYIFKYIILLISILIVSEIKFNSILQKERAKSLSLFLIL